MLNAFSSCTVSSSAVADWCTMSGERTLSDVLKEKYVESDRYNYKTGLGGEQARDELQHCSIEIRYLARGK